MVTVQLDETKKEEDGDVGLAIEERIKKEEDDSDGLVASKR